MIDVHKPFNKDRETMTTMTPAEVSNPKRRLQARRRQAIGRLAELRCQFPNSQPGSEGYRLVCNAKEQVTELQNNGK